VTWVGQIFEQQELDPALVPLLHRYSEGNPFLTTQILRTLLDDRLVQFANGRWELKSQDGIQLPAAVAGLMERRLEKLSRGTRRILSTPRDRSRVRHRRCLHAGAGTEDELLDAVDEGIAHAVLEPSARRARRTPFTHTLLVDAMTHSVNGRRLSRIHERVARHSKSIRRTTSAEIALHYDRAGNKAKTYQFALAAGSGAVSVYRTRRSAHLLGLAARSAGDRGTESQRSVPRRRSGGDRRQLRHRRAALRGSASGARTACARSAIPAAPAHARARARGRRAVRPPTRLPPVSRCCSKRLAWAIAPRKRRCSV
jgi:hypothetical protein